MSFILIIYFLIPAINAQIFIPSAKLEILTETPTNEPNAEIETQPLIVGKKPQKILKEIKGTEHFFMLFAHQMIMFSFI